MILYLQDMENEELIRLLGEEKAKVYLKNQVKKPKLGWREKLRFMLKRAKHD